MTDRALEPGDSGIATDLSENRKAFDLRDAYGLRQNQLLATLGLGRSIGGHPVTIGDATELNWLGMLSSVLPTRYQASKAFVVDSQGSKSEQIDLLIYDRHFSPVLIDIGEFPFVPAEAVYAVLEVKQEVSKETIEYAQRKVASVRDLHRTSADVLHAGGKFDPKPLPRIVGGLLATTTAWKQPYPDAVTSVLAPVGDQAALDVVCALDTGTVERAENGDIAFAGDSSSLIFLILRLLHRLQQLATVPAIDYEKYSAPLREQT